MPELDPRDITDLLLACGLPGGEQGWNMARNVAVLGGHDHLPGATTTRYCSSSLQTTRMAFHAIKAGEGDTYISAGVETVSRYFKGNSDFIECQDLLNEKFAAANKRSFERAHSGAPVWTDPRNEGQLPDVYIAMGQTAENVQQVLGMSREELDRFAVRSQNLAEHAIASGFWPSDITPVTLDDGTVISADDGPRPGTTHEAVSALKPVFRPDGTVTAGNACPLNDGAAAIVITSDTKAKELGLTPLARIVSTAVTGLSPEIMGLGSGHCDPSRVEERRHVAERHRPVRDQRSLRRAGAGFRPAAGYRRRQAQRQRWRDRCRSPLRHDRRPHHLDSDPLDAVARQAVRRRVDVRGRLGMAMVLERLS